MEAYKSIRPALRSFSMRLLSSDCSRCSEDRCEFCDDDISDICTKIHDFAVSSDNVHLADCLTTVLCSRIRVLDNCSLYQMIYQLSNVIAMDFSDDLRANCVRCIFKCVEFNLDVFNFIIQIGLVDRLFNMILDDVNPMFRVCLSCFNDLILDYSYKKMFISYLTQQDNVIRILMKKSLSFDYIDDLIYNIKFFINLITKDDINFPTSLFLNYFLEVLSTFNDYSICLDSIIGLFRITLNDPKIWSIEFEQSGLYSFIVNWIDYPYYKIAEAVMLLINSIYDQSQTISCLDPLLLLKMLEYKNQDDNIQTNVRIYASDAIYSYIYSHQQNIIKVVDLNILDISLELFKTSNFALKSEILKYLSIIATEGLLEHKIKMIKMGYLQLFFSALEYDDEIVRIAILSISELFRAGNCYPQNRQICYEIAEKCDNYNKLFQLPFDDNEIISDTSNLFLNEFYK